MGFLFCLLSLTISSLALADFPVDVAYAPDNNLELTLAAINGARQSVLLNIYELSSPQIADALIAQVNAGIHVEILEEGQPASPFSAAARGIESQIVLAMQKINNGDHFYLMSSSKGGIRRFRFDHGKYAIIDGNQLLIGSENYSPTGNAIPGTLGNRGWEVLIHEPIIAGNYHGVFVSDADTSKGDVLDLTSTVAQAAHFEASEIWSEQDDAYKVGRAAASTSATSFLASAVTRISSPDTSLSGLLGLINHAKASIDIELMTFDSNWSGATNPLVGALTQAAHRGVNVRVLLNDENTFNKPGSPPNSNPKNLPTLNILAQAGPNMHTQIANIQAMGVDYIHNKGMLVDNNITLISSINWDQNSIQNNREAAVAITSTNVHGYYEALFGKDWLASGGQ